jgi:Flp pilus assembly protein TadD
LEHSPDEPLVYRALGQVWLDRAQAHNDRVFLSKALEALTRVASGPAATSEVLTLYGRALLLDDQVEAAERALDQARTRFPIDPSSLLLLATAAERQNHFDAAREALVSYMSLVPEDPEIVARAMHIATLSTRLRDYQTAILWLERAIERNPDDGRVLAALADAQMKAGYVAAAQATQAAIMRGLEKDARSVTLESLQRSPSLARPTSSVAPVSGQ